MRTLSWLPLPLLLLVAGTAYGAASPLEVQRVLLPATLMQSAKKVPLLPKRALVAGDRLSIGANGRASLTLDRNGILIIGENSDLFIHSIENAHDGAGALVRLALSRGSLRLDTTPRDGQPVQDMRLNVGTLRLRVQGAEVWANAEPGLNQTVCLLQGTVHVINVAGDEVLDTPGDCYRYGYNNVSMRLRPESDDLLARKLSRTAFPGERYIGRPPVAVAAPLPPPAAPTPLGAPGTEPPASATPTAAASMDIAASEPTPPPQPAASAPPAMPVVTTAAAAEPVADTADVVLAASAWTVVVASVRNEAAARSESSRLIGRGLPAGVQGPTAEGFYRVYIGQFSTREAARKHADLLRRTTRIKGWVMQLP